VYYHEQLLNFPGPLSPSTQKSLLYAEKRGVGVLSREKGRGAIDLSTGSYISLVLLGWEEGAT
jgi:hypothetical protein